MNHSALTMASLPLLCQPFCSNLFRNLSEDLLESPRRDFARSAHLSTLRKHITEVVKLLYCREPIDVVDEVANTSKVVLISHSEPSQHHHRRRLRRRFLSQEQRMDQRRRADQAQRTNSLIEVHTKKWGGATKGPFKVGGFDNFVLPIKGLSCLDEIKLAANVFSAMPIRFNNHNRNQSAALLADVYRSSSIRISNQKCATQKISTTPNATTGRHSLEYTINVPLPANPIITTAAPQRRQQARREKNPFARNASLTL